LQTHTRHAAAIIHALSFVGVEANLTIASLVRGQMGQFSVMAMKHLIVRQSKVHSALLKYTERALGPPAWHSERERKVLLQKRGSFYSFDDMYEIIDPV
jgi:hypothetical protein